MKQLIIERPDLQTSLQKYGYATATLLFWLLYVYLWMPLVSLLAWGLQFSFAYEHMIAHGGYKDLVKTLGSYGLAILVMSAVYIAWAAINYFRFHNLERRTAPDYVKLSDQAMAFGVQESALYRWQHSKNLVVYHDENGRVARVKVNEDARDVQKQASTGNWPVSLASLLIR